MFSNDGGQDGHRQDQDAKDSARVMRIGAILWRPRWRSVVTLVLVVALVGLSWLFLHRRDTQETPPEHNLTSPVAAENGALPRQREQQAHTTRRITEFLGVDLSGRYDLKHCGRGVVGGMDQFKFETQRCRMKENEAHTVAAIYVTDTRFPDLVGRILEVYAILHRSIWADQAAFDGYMGAITEKYGPLQPVDASQQLTNVDELLFCSGTSCDGGSLLYDPEASHFALGMDRHFGYQAFSEVSFVNRTMFLGISETLDASRKNAAAAAVE